MTPSNGGSGVMGELRMRAETVEWTDAIALGILAFPVGYVVTGLVVLVGGSLQGDLVGVLVLLGFVFYSAFNVPVDVSGGGQFNYIASSPNPAVPLVVYYAVPIVVLVAAGGLATVWLLRGRFDPVETVLTVVALSIGFGVMAVLGSFVFTTATITGETARIPLVEAALFGFLYPLIFGLIGAGLVQVVDTLRVSG